MSLGLWRAEHLHRLLLPRSHPHQLVSNLPRERLIEAGLHVDLGKLFKLGLRILAQLLTLARAVGLLGCRIVS